MDALRIAKLLCWALLGFAIVAEKHRLESTAFPDKSFYFLGGLTEATETSVAKD